VSKALPRILYPPHLRRTLLIAATVGTWLTLFNQGDTLITKAMTAVLLGKVCLNYLTPFVVANLGLLSGKDTH
jgi:hypothetical protein